jgi:hypothetical protein
MSDAAKGGGGREREREREGSSRWTGICAVRAITSCILPGWSGTMMVSIEIEGVVHGGRHKHVKHDVVVPVCDASACVFRCLSLCARRSQMSSDAPNKSS